MIHMSLSAILLAAFLTLAGNLSAQQAADRPKLDSASANQNSRPATATTYTPPNDDMHKGLEFILNQSAVSGLEQQGVDSIMSNKDLPEATKKQMVEQIKKQYSEMAKNSANLKARYSDLNTGR
jgi:hypothetical protein